jgi:hypothetical protein
MAMHLEFVIPGPPISNQQSTPQGRANLAAWKATIAGAVTVAWPNALRDLEGLFQLRNIIVHGFAVPRFETSSVEFLLRTATQLLESPAPGKEELLPLGVTEEAGTR